MSKNKYMNVNAALDDREVEDLLEEEEEQVEFSEYVSHAHHEDLRRARARSAIEDHHEKQRLRALIGDYYGDFDNFDDE